MKDIIAWWSGGVTSAVTCKLCIDLFGLNRVRVIFIDTRNEDDDTYRFKEDCEQWYGCEIETISSNKFKRVEDVWFKYLSLNVATGAICSTHLKRKVREEWQKTSAWLHQAFGFELSESRRAISMTMNNPDVRSIYPLLMYGLTKADCIIIIEVAGIAIPRMYKLGFLNNNCFTTMCVQGGIGYWQKVGCDLPDKFDYMADIEHQLTDLKGEPVTMLKDQSKEAKESGNFQVFLKPHPKYPHLKDISMMKGREPEPLVECNGFCGINDLMPQNKTQLEINVLKQVKP